MLPATKTPIGVTAGLNWTSANRPGLGWANKIMARVERGDTSMGQYAINLARAALREGDGNIEAERTARREPGSDDE